MNRLRHLTLNYQDDMPIIALFNYDEEDNVRKRQITNRLPRRCVVNCDDEHQREAHPT